MLKIDGEDTENFTLGLCKAFVHLNPLAFSESPNPPKMESWRDRLVAFAKEHDGQDISIANVLLSDLSKEASECLLCFKENLKSGDFALAKNDIELARFVFNLQIGINPRMLDIRLANQAVSLKADIRDTGEWFVDVFSDLHYIEVFCVGLYLSEASSGKERNEYYIQVNFDMFLEVLDRKIKLFEGFFDKEPEGFLINDYSKKERSERFSKSVDLKGLKVALENVPEYYDSGRSLQSLDKLDERVGKIKDVLCEIYGNHTARAHFPDVFIDHGRGRGFDSNGR